VIFRETAYGPADSIVDADGLQVLIDRADAAGKLVFRHTDADWVPMWRGTQLARASSKTVDTGYPILSAELPGGGWPRLLICHGRSRRRATVIEPAEPVEA
jgi:hypothetical protein